MTGRNLHLLAQVSADQLVNCLLQGMLISLVAWTLLRLSRRTGSVTRFAVWFLALLVIALLPIAGLLGGNVDAAALSASRTALRLPQAWALYLFVVWAGVALLALAKVGAGLFRLVQLRRSCTALDCDGLDPVLRQSLQEFKSRRPVTLCTSDALNVPAAIGFFKPAVVFPTWAMEELSVPELNSILLHELAHLARWDDWTNLTQKIVRAIFFFHPAVWWIDSCLSLEREMACDDIVLARTANPRAYAECLVSLTEKGLLHRGFQFVQAAISRVRQTTLRVTQILDNKRQVSTTVCKPAFTLLALAALGCSVASPLAPRLVSFEGAAPVGHPALEARTSNSYLHQAAYHLASPRKLESSATPQVANAAVHPHSVSSDVTSANEAISVKLVAQRHVVARQRMTPRRAATNSPIEFRSVRQEVVLVVMQQRFYDQNGQPLLRYSVYRFLSFEPVAGTAAKPKKI